MMLMVISKCFQLLDNAPNGRTSAYKLRRKKQRTKLIRFSFPLFSSQRTRERRERVYHAIREYQFLPRGYGVKPEIDNCCRAYLIRFCFMAQIGLPRMSWQEGKDSIEKYECPYTSGFHKKSILVVFVRTTFMQEEKSEVEIQYLKFMNWKKVICILEWVQKNETVHDLYTYYVYLTSCSWSWRHVFLQDALARPTGRLIYGETKHSKC